VGDRVRTWAYRVALSILIAVFVGISGYRFPGAGRDDVFLLLWSGETLGAGPWFINYNYDPQEMISSVTGALAAAAAFLVAPEATFLVSKLFGFGAAAVTLALLWWAREVIFERGDAAPLALAAVFTTGLSPVFEYWSLGGLETPYQALFLLAYVVGFAVFDRRPGAGAALALIAIQILVLLTRTEGFWLLGASAALVALRARQARGVRWDVAVLAVPTVFFLALTGLRWYATGLAFPNPTYAKVGSFDLTLPLGAEYLLAYALQSALGLLHAGVTAVACLVVLRAAAALLLPGRRKAPAFPLLACCGVIVGQELFVLAIGGNWMEYFRFLAPTVPLKNVVLVWLAADALGRLGGRLPQRATAVAACAVLIALCLQQQGMSGRTPMRGARKCSATLPSDFFGASIEEMNERAIALSCTHARENANIRPFIEGTMRCFVERAGPLTLTSYQAGYFTYLVRKNFAVDEVRFFGTMGLINREVARLPVPKDPVGIVGGNRIDLIVAGRKGALSEQVRAADPDMLYLISAPGKRRETFASSGYQLVWEQPRAVVFFRSAQAETIRACAPPTG
jgi:hypothetical protein